MKDRILKIIEELQLTPSGFADEVGLNRAVVSHILHGRNKPGLENLQRILARYPEINPGWLITGAGSMFLSGSPEKKAGLFDETEEFQDDPSFESENAADLASKPVFFQPNTNVNQQVNMVLPPTVKVKKIAVFYSDNTYEEFIPVRKD